MSVSNIKINTFSDSLSRGSNSTTSDESHFMLEQLMQIIDDQQSTGIGTDKWEKIFIQLFEIADYCSVEDWDGYGATPVNLFAIKQIREFLSQLPDLPIPEIIPDNDGSIALQWYRDKGNQLIISFNGEPELVYSGIFNYQNRSRGFELFSTYIAESILDLIKRIYYSS